MNKKILNFSLRNWEEKEYEREIYSSNEKN